MVKQDESDSWDFYPCRVDDKPASIFLDMSYLEQHPALDTLYYTGLEIVDPDTHGMGTPAEAEKLWILEEAIASRAEGIGFVQVARMRNDGDWQISFYAEAGKADQLRDIVVATLADEERGYRLGSDTDPEWRYYHDFLLPDFERWQWMMDRRVVEQLAQSGDQHEIAREVDHFIHFATADQRDACARAAEAMGFRHEASGPDDSELPYGLELHRDDPVELEHIHAVAMSLSELAEQNEGDYDGWGCVVVTSADAGGP